MAIAITFDISVLLVFLYSSLIIEDIEEVKNIISNCLDELDSQFVFSRKNNSDTWKFYKSDNDGYRFFTGKVKVFIRNIHIEDSDEAVIAGFSINAEFEED